MRLVLWAFAPLLAGMAWASFQADNRLSAVLPESLENNDIGVSGTLCSVPEPGQYGSVRFAFCVHQWFLPEGYKEEVTSLPQRLRLTWYGDNATLSVPSRLRLTVRLKRPHGSVNPQGFRYENWLFRQGYGATGTIRALREETAVVCGVVCRYHQWRGRLVRQVSSSLKDMESGPLVLSLMLGYRGALEPGHWSTLKATGTIHLVAISGLHLGLIAVGAGFVTRRTIVWLPERWLPPSMHRRALFFAVCVASLIYALVAGFTVPTRRALVMVWLVAWWILTSRRGRALDSFLVAAALVLVLDPFALLDQGFWLSFAAVAVLIVVFSARLKPLGSLQGLVLAQIAVFAGLWPVLAAFDQSQPLMGLMANLVAIPVVSFVVMPVMVLSAMVLFWTPGLWPVFERALDGLLSALWEGLVWMSAVSLPDLAASGVALASLAVLVVTAIVVPTASVRWVTSTLVLGWGWAVFVSPMDEVRLNPPVEHPELWVWDVGQGLAALIRLGDKVVVYDTGPELEGVYSSVESILIPNMRALGIQRIDVLVVSHGDNDHSGGLRQLSDVFSIDHFVSGEPERLRDRLPERLSESVRPCGDEQPPKVPGLMVWQASKSQEGNDASCVLRLFLAGGYELVLPGDITESAEALLVSEVLHASPKGPSYRVLIAPHHGSKTSSSDVLLDAYGPDLVVFSAGYQHRYGHPHEDIVARYRRRNSAMFNTARSGAIRMIFHPDGLRLTQSRSGTPFWIRDPEAVR